MARAGHRSKPPSFNSLFNGHTSFASPASPQLPVYTESDIFPTHREKSSSPAPTSRRPWSRLPRRFYFFIFAVVILGIVLLMLFIRRVPLSPPASVPLSAPPPNSVRTPDARQYLKGPPAPTYAENLRDDVQYITGFIGAGWTNDVMTYANLIYLALLTQRVPIISVFTPSHLPKEAGFVAFGDVFDVPRLSAEINLPVLEWRDVKDVNSSNVEVFGCWSSWMGIGDTNPRGTVIPAIVGLDVSYTPVPQSLRIQQGDPHLSMHKLMMMGFPSGRNEVLAQTAPIPAPASGLTVEPNDHLLCFDYLYYLGVDRGLEWEYDWSPQWRLVGKHMRWSPALQGLARQYINRHFGIEAADAPIPAYIAVHARRGDFAYNCGSEGNMTHCLPSVAQMGRRIREVRSELALRHGVYTDRVLVMSDEQDPVWWAQIAENGWTWINHTVQRTDETYGKWYSPLLDAVFQSSGAAFVGTEGSTMSLLAARRTQDWYDGPITYMKFRGDISAEDL